MKRPLPAAWLATLALAGCAPALREPPTVAEMAAHARAHDGETRVAELLDRAARAFERREPGAARAAAADYLRAASLDATSVDGLVGAARVRSWLAGQGSDEPTRRADALGAVQAAQRCVERAPDDPRCNYALAVALGVQARERRATALDALPRIVELLERAIERDATLDRAGPQRVLALVLVRAPGWPSGPGDPDAALEHARRAVELAPEHPPNRLALAEALDAVGEIAAAAAEYRSALALARAALARGEPDAGAWLAEARMGVSR